MKIARIELDNGVCLSIRDDQLPMTIGRAKECDIRISEPTVSRLHCELYLDKAQALCLKDLSANGTSVDNQNLFGDSVRIADQCNVRLAGDSLFKLTLTDNDGVTLFPMP